jgi:hypothetical protein
MEARVQKSKDPDDCPIVEKLAIERMERAQQAINSDKDKDQTFVEVPPGAGKKRSNPLRGRRS